jgi:hypothetical protein
LDQSSRARRLMRTVRRIKPQRNLAAQATHMKTLSGSILVMGTGRPDGSDIDKLGGYWLFLRHATSSASRSRWDGLFLTL